MGLVVVEIREEIDAWVKEHFHGSPIATDTALWNHFHAAVTALKDRLDPPPISPSEVEPVTSIEPKTDTQETVS